MNTKVVTIHQPNYAPWTGFFDKLAQADVFVLLDTVPYTKGGFQNRVKVMGSAGPQWLTVPVLTKGLLGQATSEVRVDDLKGWRETHMKTLRTLYSRAPHADEMFALVEPAVASGSDRLADICTDLIGRIVRRFGFDTELVLASRMGITGSSSQLLADIVTECGGTTYLSGPSGRSYLDEELFTQRGIGVEYHSFVPRPYDQGREGFIGGLSILDAVAHLGFVPDWRGEGEQAPLR